MMTTKAILCLTKVLILSLWQRISSLWRFLICNSTALALKTTHFLPVSRVYHTLLVVCTHCWVVHHGHRLYVLFLIFKTPPSLCFPQMCSPSWPLLTASLLRGSMTFSHSPPLLLCLTTTTSTRSTTTRRDQQQPQRSRPKWRRTGHSQMEGLQQVTHPQHLHLPR